MCGIAGIVFRAPGADTAADRSRLAAALLALRHRGPDDEGSCARSGALFGHRRLSILDLSAAGHQPMCSKSGRLLVTFNGEIYNYLELRRELEQSGHTFHTGSDTEVLLAATEQWGRAAVEKFRGMFAFGLWDESRRTLLLARDRVGERPLYYWRDHERFLFASELKALLALMPSRPALSAASVDAYFHYQYPLDPQTMVEGVRKLPAGHVLEISADRWDDEPARYWSLSAAPARDGDPLETLRAALDEAVELTLRSDAPLGVALSGGIDSGLLAALARRKRADVTAFTVGYPGQYRHDERSMARDLAARLDIPWKSAELTTDAMASFFPDLVRAMDEPVADVAAYGHFSVSRLAAEHGVKVLVTGIGGDELFFGYGWVRDALRLSQLKLRTLASASSLERLRAGAMKMLLDTAVLANLLTNRRLPAWWRARAEGALDYGRIDLEHEDEWVFYQIDYHWPPACRHTAETYADAFKAALPERSAFGLMNGLREPAVDPQIHICQLLFDSWLISNCLGLGDRMSMASGVETRVPLLDSALIEATVGFWKGGRADDSQGHKLWLRAIAADTLPPEVLSRPKLGFTTPTVEWMAAINTRYRQSLEDGTLVSAGVLDGDRLRRWLAAPRGSVQRDFFQYKLTLLETWHRVVMGEREVQ